MDGALTPDLNPKTGKIVPIDAWLAGGAAGLFIEATLFPLDALKTRLQAKKTMKKPASMYSGLSSILLGGFPSSAIFFGTYESTKNYALSDERKATISIARSHPMLYHMLAQFGCAALADLLSSIFWIPFEVIKQQLQLGQHKSFYEATFNIYQKQGTKGFYTGFVPMLWREIPFAGIEFVIWENLKTWASRWSSQHQTLTAALSGCVAGGLAALATMPFDVVKTRMMTQEVNEKYVGTIDCFQKIYRHEGIRALFRGTGPRVTWISLGGILFFGSYEYFSSALQSFRSLSNSKLEK